MKYKVFRKNQIWAYDTDFDSAHNADAEPVFSIKTYSDRIEIRKYSKVSKNISNVYHYLISNSYYVFDSFFDSNFDLKKEDML